MYPVPSINLKKYLFWQWLFKSFEFYEIFDSISPNICVSISIWDGYCVTLITGTRKMHMRYIDGSMIQCLNKKMSICDLTLLDKDFFLYSGIA